MTFLNAKPHGGNPSTNGTSVTLGPFISIGLPHTLAVHLAGTRQILALDPKAIGTSGVQTMPDAVAGCLLLGGKKDALDVIDELCATGYRGGLIVVAPPMPDLRMVEKELGRAAASIPITLVVL